MLKVTDLFQRFGDLVAVDDVSLEVDTGHIVGLVGRNGAGKTTVMRAVMGVLRPERGAISFDGAAVDSDVRMQFGYMPEERGLYPQMRIIDQVRYFARLHGLDAETANSRAHSWLERLGLGVRANDRLIALSHGNQQRVQLAVALVHEPSLLVLDEPFAGLDPTAIDSLSDILQTQAKEGKAILFSSHQLELVERLCDQVVILEQGKVLASGPLDELSRRGPTRVRVKVSPPSDWAAGVVGTRVVAEDSDGLVLELEPRGDPQQILRSALAAGDVEHFGFERTGLSDLYRKLVSA